LVNTIKFISPKEVMMDHIQLAREMRSRHFPEDLVEKFEKKSEDLGPPPIEVLRFLDQLIRGGEEGLESAKKYLQGLFEDEEAIKISVLKVEILPEVGELLGALIKMAASCNCPSCKSRREGNDHRDSSPFSPGFPH
jgi:hypothetical protein